MGAARGSAVIAGLLIASPALAEGVLPIGGAYGNEPGCRAYMSGDFDIEGLAVLTPHTFTTDAGGCYFETLVSRSAGQFAVDASCEDKGEGRARDERLTISGSDAEGYGVALGDSRWGPLARCAGTEDLFSRPGTQI